MPASAVTASRKRYTRLSGTCIEDGRETGLMASTSGDNERLREISGLSFDGIQADHGFIADYLGAVYHVLGNRQAVARL